MILVENMHYTNKIFLFLNEPDVVWCFPAPGNVLFLLMEHNYSYMDGQALRTTISRTNRLVVGSYLSR